MREVPLTQGFVALVDDADFERVIAEGKWHTARRRRGIYAERMVQRDDGSRCKIGLHTFITGWAFTDHIDGDGLNNCRSNLREATHAQNVRNAPKRIDNRSGYKGVSWSASSSKWVAQINEAGRRRKHLGYFTDPAEAARAYDAAALAIYGSFARVNFPGEVAA